MNELLTLSALELARRIRAKHVSPVEVIDAHIDRIERVNPLINAVIETDFDAARTTAKVYEQQLAGSRKVTDAPPLFGVPCTIKDTFAQRGLPWTAGCMSRADVVAERDATVVQRLKDAGAIPMGRTNVPEAAMWVETYNAVYGRTNNPHHLNHIVGGSSGGEGAVIAAGGSPFGPGSDVGGSIRFPSFFNGVIGHKPSGGLVAGTGHYPAPEGPVKRYSVVGPLGRSVDDVALLLKLIAGPDGVDDSVVKQPLGDPASVNLKQVRVFYYADNGVSRPAPSVVEAIEQAAEALKERGCTVTPWRPEDLKHSAFIWMAKLNAYQGAPFKNVLGNGRPIPVFAEAAKWVVGASRHTFPALALALLEELGGRFGGRDSPRMAEFVDKGDKLQADIEEKLGPAGVLLCPPYSRPAPKHNGPWRTLPAISYSAIYNVLEFPATVVPILRTDVGLPVGVQVVGSRFADHVTLAVAKALEREFGGWRIADTV